MPSLVFEKADKFFWHDKFLNKVFLRFIPYFILPNHITVFRFLTTPLLIFLMLVEEYYIGLGAFLFVAFSDAVDGSLARIRSQVTEWGRIYDPLADKFLIGSMVFVIVYKYIDPLTAFLIVGVEIFIIFQAWRRIKQNKYVQANGYGKIKMCLQVIGVAVLLLAVIYHLDVLLPFVSGTFYLAIAFAVISLWHHGA